MTTKIEDLSDEEINENIAIIFGYHFMHNEKETLMVHPNNPHPSGGYWDSENFIKGDGRPESELTNRGPNYCTCRNAAFQAVEFLRKEKGIAIEFDNRKDGGIWDCCAVRLEDGAVIEWIENESLPHAICEAFLKATEETK